TLRYRSSGGVRLAAVRLGSPAADLAAIADRLAASYHWDPLDAVAWVVSGATPAFRPLIVRLLTTDRAATSRIILEVDPRLPRDRVAEVYSAARQHEEIARLVTGSARPLEAKTAELATFLARHERDTWAAMRTRWNQDHK